MLALVLGAFLLPEPARSQVRRTSLQQPGGTDDAIGTCPTVCDFLAGPGTTTGPMLDVTNCDATIPIEAGSPGGSPGVCPTTNDCGPCGQETLTYRVDTTNNGTGTPAIDTDQTKLLCVPAFPSTMGTLKRVELRVRDTLTYDNPSSYGPGPGMVMAIENLSTQATCEPWPAGQPFPWRFRATFNLFLGDRNGPAIINDYVSFIDVPNPCPLPPDPNVPCLGTFDGSIDGLGTSGRFTRLTPYVFCHVRCIDEDDGVGLDISDFIGAPGSTIGFCDRVAVSRDVDTVNCGNVNNLHYSEFITELEVTYTFCSNNPPIACDDDGGDVCPPSECRGSDCERNDQVCTTPVNILANDCEPDCDCIPGAGACEASDCVKGCVNGCTDEPRKTIDPASVILCPNSTTCSAVNTDNPAAPCMRATGNMPIMVTKPKGTAIYYPVAMDGFQAGDIVFCPNPDANGTRNPVNVTFFYRVADGEGCYSTDCAQITFTVLPKPTANPDTMAGCEGVCVVVDLTDDDTPSTNGDDSDVDPTTVQICVGPAHGTVYQPGDEDEPGFPEGVVLAPGEVAYCAAAGYSGPDMLTYRVANGYGCWSDCATVSLTVYGNPVCADDDMGYVCQGESKAFSLFANDTIPAGATPDPTTLTLCRGVGCTDCANPGSTLVTSQGRVTINTGTGLITYTANDDARGPDVFYYSYLDSRGCPSGCCEVTIYILARPVANDDQECIDPDVDDHVDIVVVENDTDQDGDLGTCAQPWCPGGCTPSYHIEICTQPLFGTITNIDQATGTVTYQPGAGFGDEGDFFYYKVTDCFGCESECARVTICTVECVQYDRRKPGSLLLYPEWDNRDGCRSIVTVTNTRSGGGPVDVEFRYIDRQWCLYFGKTKRLTPKETFTICTDDHNPGQGRGYMYLYAKEAEIGGQPIVWNYLVGQLLVTDGYDMDHYAMNAVSFRGVGETGMRTDDPLENPCADGDGIRDLDDCEYEAAPDEILIPRFLGQDEGYQSDLILINLSGGASFTTEVDLTIFNDNEDQFSRTYGFYCWDKRPLLEISEVFGNEYLQMFSDQDPTEILGLETREAGWIKIDGRSSSSPAKVILDPAIYAVLVEHRIYESATTSVSDLPWEYCSQTNGSLLPKGFQGDNDD